MEKTKRELREILQEGFNMKVEQASDLTKVSFQMERLSRNCRLAGVNIFDFLREELITNVEKIIKGEEIAPEEKGFECPNCGRKFKSQQALTGHGPKRCRT